MRRVLIIASIIFILLPSSALALECNTGEYKGMTWSVTRPLGGQAASLIVSLKDGWCEMRLSIPSASINEIWKLKNNKLQQVDLDTKGNEKLGYGATLEVRKGVEGYYIDCPGGVCDAGVDSRYFWTLKAPGNMIVYTVWGVAPDKQSNPKAKAQRRHEYTFTKIK